MKSPLAILALLAAAVATGATGVAILWGAGWTLLFVSAFLATCAVILIRGASRG